MANKTPKIKCLINCFLVNEKGFFKISPNFRSFFLPNLHKRIMIAIACPNKRAKMKLAVVKGSRSNRGMKITIPKIPKPRE